VEETLVPGENHRTVASPIGDFHGSVRFPPSIKVCCLTLE